MRLTKTTNWARLLLLISFTAGSATANLVEFNTPDSNYLGATNLISLLPPTFQETGMYTEITDGTLTIRFETKESGNPGWSPHPMLLFTAGPASGWPSGWGSMPETEGYAPDMDPQVLYTDYGYSAILMTFSRPLRTFGFEIQPDRVTGGRYSLTATYDGVGQMLGVVTRGFDDAGGSSPISARLLAARSNSEPIVAVSLSGWDESAGQPVEWAGARFRYELAPSEVPEPASRTLLLLGGVAAGAIIRVRAGTRRL